jgi:surface antigen
MRTFHRNAPIIIGAGALAVLLFAPAPLLLKAEERGAEMTATSIEQKPQAERPVKSALDRSDRHAAMAALQLALTELGDGVTLIWQRPARGLKGRITLRSAFQDDRGRICRHLVYWLAHGDYERQIEAIGCREPDGRWSLSG